MTEIKRLWTPNLSPYPEGDIARICREAPAKLREVCCCFWLFRYLHRFEEPASVLVGDYCFGRFSHHLTKLDSVSVTDAFAEYLGQDALSDAGLSEYVDFIHTLERCHESV